MPAFTDLIDQAANLGKVGARVESTLPEASRASSMLDTIDKSIGAKATTAMDKVDPTGTNMQNFGLHPELFNSYHYIVNTIKDQKEDPALSLKYHDLQTGIVNDINTYKNVLTTADRDNMLKTLKQGYSALGEHNESLISSTDRAFLANGIGVDQKLSKAVKKRFGFNEVYLASQHGRVTPATLDAITTQTGLPPKALSLGGRLRLYGSSSRATEEWAGLHIQSKEGKTSDIQQLQPHPATLAHEWAHSLDEYLGMAYGLEANKRLSTASGQLDVTRVGYKNIESPFASKDPLLLRPGLETAWKELHRVIMQSNMAEISKTLDPMYHGQDHELFARAFEAWLIGKMKVPAASVSGFMPFSEDMPRLDTAFQKFFDALKTKEMPDITGKPSQILYGISGVPLGVVQVNKKEGND